MPGCIGPLESQQDVGRNRNQLKAHEQQHQVVGQADDREADQQDQKGARLFAGAVTAAAAVGLHRCPPAVSRLHQCQQQAGAVGQQPDRSREAIEGDRPRGDRRTVGWLAPGQQQGDAQAAHRHQPARPETAEGGGQVGG